MFTHWCPHDCAPCNNKASVKLPAITTCVRRSCHKCVPTAVLHWTCHQTWTDRLKLLHKERKKERKKKRKQSTDATVVAVVSIVLNKQSVSYSVFFSRYSKELTAFTQHATTPSALLSARERKQSQLIGHFSSCNQSGLRILDRSALLRDECVKQSINPPPPPPLHARDLFSYS